MISRLERISPLNMNYVRVCILAEFMCLSIISIDRFCYNAMDVSTEAHERDIVVMATRTQINQFGKLTHFENKTLTPSSSKKKVRQFHRIKSFFLHKIHQSINANTNFPHKFRVEERYRRALQTSLEVQ